ncbi:phosphatase PAP2 family protein [Nocardioides sp. YIM 152315]|uniref:phosphatase PAP2 family protein n=1 Tax=Nocardioides sp. YIM 152315 TaxID=3031760 RepID=UPI0023DC7AAB|nr:phosphatase PAP2 family protein [Nocardioides sp. YIM 152315]MDF1606211.1 phosphatase PAP2 family protein [Nocardioides sp. YIM 152315]
MYRRAWTLLVVNAIAMGIWAVVTAWYVDRPLIDPESSFLGSSWFRLPILCFGALFLDLVPRAIWLSRGRVARMPQLIRERWHAHWSRERLLLVLLGIVSFYVIYVCYRNLKSFLPLVSDRMYDRELHMLDKVLFFGHEPGSVVHDLLGTTYVAHVLSNFYLLFIPMVAIMVTVWLVWSRNLSYGWWFVTSQGLAWTLGTISYYALPTLGPGLEYQYLYQSLAHTGTADLMNSLVNARQGVLWGDGQAQTVAGFASLHTGIGLLWALMVQFTVRTRWIRVLFWVNFGLIVVATIYFGWHYIADDIAGVMIAFISFYVGGIASGQKFDRHGLASHPTTTTSHVPVDR